MTIEGVRSALEGSPKIQVAESFVTVTRKNLSKLVAVRRAHQTERASKSVKTRANPQDATPTPRVQTDRQQLSAQMAETIRRAGSGLERNARWKCRTTPGTRGLAEILALAGNSANAEVVAKG